MAVRWNDAVLGGEVEGQISRGSPITPRWACLT